jgi:hypothetical protein
VRVEWPSGIVQELLTSRRGQFLTITETLPIEIDVRPESARTPVQSSSRGVIPVAALGSADFEVRDVDLPTLAFGPEGAAPAHRKSARFHDVNNDGFVDLVSHYRIKDAGLGSGDGEACLTGYRFDGARFEGCEAIDTVPDGRQARGRSRR